MVSFLRSLNAKFKNNDRISKRIGYILLTVSVILARKIKINKNKKNKD